MPLLASKLGNNTGVPLGMNLTSPGLRDVVLLDVLNAPARENPANLVICGSPGRGKSHVTKNLCRSWLKIGAGLHLFDPTDARALSTAPRALARAAVRAWLRPTGDGQPPSAAAVERVLAVASGDHVATEVAGGWRVRRSSGRLHLDPPPAG